ncbi:hypothetical protein DSECCO2_175580 [anaerobic digester metagenome]
MAVHTVAVETESNMIVYASFSHGFQGFFYHGKCFGLMGLFPVPEEEEQVVWCWEFLVITETSVFLVKVFKE